MVVRSALLALVGLACGADGFGSGVATRHASLSTRRAATILRAAADGALEPGDTVTVIGASGNVGKLVALRLSETFKVRAVVRDAARAKVFLGGKDNVEFFETAALGTPAAGGAEALRPALEGAAAVVVCTGTTAFPTKAWAGGAVGADDVAGAVWNAWSGADFDRGAALAQLTADGLNTPDAVDDAGVCAVAAAAGEAASAGGALKRFVLMSSIGVTRRGGFPFSVLNACGVLDAKANGEAAVAAAARAGGFSSAIVRPGQLFGGPYDNNFYLGTLFQLDKDTETRGVALTRGDTAAGDTLRSALAEVLYQTVASPTPPPADFTVITEKGEPPSAEELLSELASLA